MFRLSCWVLFRKTFDNITKLLRKETFGDFSNFCNLVKFFLKKTPREGQNVKITFLVYY